MRFVHYKFISDCCTDSRGMLSLLNRRLGGGWLNSFVLSGRFVRLDTFSHIILKGWLHRHDDVVTLKLIDYCSFETKIVPRLLKFLSALL